MGELIIYIVGFIIAYMMINRFTISEIFTKDDKWDGYARGICGIMSLFSWFSVFVVTILFLCYSNGICKTIRYRVSFVFEFILKFLEK